MIIAWFRCSNWLYQIWIHLLQQISYALQAFSTDSITFYFQYWSGGALGAAKVNSKAWILEQLQQSQSGEVGAEKLQQSSCRAVAAKLKSKAEEQSWSSGAVAAKLKCKAEAAEQLQQSWNAKLKRRSSCSKAEVQSWSGGAVAAKLKCKAEVAE